MADESEKRFHAIMDKLFHAPPRPKSTPATQPQSASESGVQLSRGKKRPAMESAFSASQSKRVDIVGRLRNSSVGPVQTPLCRPWDRGDLMKRLATFKSMTWFGKPEVVSAVNCARRGWINVDADTIACEACGARIFFSTPSSWAHHQVEKAALVFSLKLDNGHKQLCPWIDNACDEKLAQFPPRSAEVLVDEYKERLSTLSHLAALPVISSSSIDYMKSPQLEHFLRDDRFSNKSAETYQREGSEIDSNSSTLYNQAKKIISLCGWEPRSLPYIVDCKMYQSASDPNHSDLSSKASSGCDSLVVYTSGTSETMESNDVHENSRRVQTDPSSVVLECKLCGASVGLWAFSTAERPLELLRLAGSTEVNGEHDSADQNEDAVCRNVVPSGAGVDSRESTLDLVPASLPSSSARQSNLKLTIAGGPPPTRQNFKAKISLPVIGRNLRARISSDSDFMTLQQSKNHRVTSSTTDNVHEETTTISTDMPDIGGSSTLVGESSGTSAVAHDTTGEGMSGASNALVTFEADAACLQQNLDTDNEHGSSQSVTGISVSLPPVNNVAVPYIAGDETDQLPSDKAMGFDPIKQHRHFCPWIASTGNSQPGWQRTLSALQRLKEFSCPSPASAPSTSFIEVDDPIASIKFLFASPSPKKAKPTRVSG